MLLVFKGFCILSRGSTVSAQYLQGHFGSGQLKIKYCQLDFTPNALYALGSPIAVFLTLRGVQDLGEFFQLPTCPRVYNIFHPVSLFKYGISLIYKKMYNAFCFIQKKRKRRFFFNCCMVLWVFCCMVLWVLFRDEDTIIKWITEWHN